MRAKAHAIARLHAACAFADCSAPVATALRAKLESTGALRRLRARLRADVTLALEAEQQARFLRNAFACLLLPASHARALAAAAG